jgi:hypothetical protein
VGTQCHKAIYIVFIALKILAFSFLPVYSGIKYRSKEALAMNNSERIGMSAIMVVALILLLASLASAQGILDGKWFSVKVKTTTLWWQSTTHTDTETDRQLFSIHAVCLEESESGYTAIRLCYLDPRHNGYMAEPVDVFLVRV